MSDPTTHPDRDPAVSEFARRHEAWTVWKAISGRFYARLTARPALQVMAEDLADLSIEIRRAETEQAQA